MTIRFFSIALICCLFFMPAVRAVADQEATLPQEAALPQEVIDISNHIILKIYQDIFDSKVDYPELQNFNETNLFKNAHGIYGIRYEDKNPKTGDPYSLGVTIGKLGDKDFSGEEKTFHYGFPKVDLKISGFQQKHPLRTHFDLMPLVSKYGMILAEYQQKFMPLRVFIQPVKDVFKVRENIEFDVILENVSKRHMIVKSLGKDTLYFLINNQVWGTSPLSGHRGGTDVILKSGQRKILRFKGDSFQEPQDLEITCFYRMSIDEVNPIGKAHITIQEE